MLAFGKHQLRFNHHCRLAQGASQGYGASAEVKSRLDALLKRLSEEARGMAK